MHAAVGEPLLKKREIMQRIENILLFAIASGMACKLVSFFIKDVNEKRIRFECHLTAGFGNWHRVAVGFIHGLTVWIKPNCYQFTAVIIKRRQWVKQGLLLFPCLTNRHRLPVDMPFIILHTSLKKQLVQLLKRCSFGNRHQIVSASKPNPAFYLTFLPTGARRAEMGLKQIVGAKGHKGAVFYPLSFFAFLLHCQLHRSREVIIANADRNPAKVFECLHMTKQEAFLPLGRKGHHERAARIAQPQHKELDYLPDTANNGNCFPPVALRVLSRFKVQWKKDIRRFVLFFPLCHIDYCSESRVQKY